MLAEIRDTIAQDEDSIGKRGEINASLHAILSHLNRYKAELSTSGRIIRLILSIDHSETPSLMFLETSVRDNLNILSERFKSLEVWVEQLGNKIKTVMELVNLTHPHTS